jgi:hypothetical protein
LKPSPVDGRVSRHVCPLCRECRRYLIFPLTYLQACYPLSYVTC